MKVEKKRWIVMKNGKPRLSDFDDELFDSKEDALKYARTLLEEDRDAAFTVQEWVMTEEVELH